MHTDIDVNLKLNNVYRLITPCLVLLRDFLIHMSQSSDVFNF